MSYHIEQRYMPIMETDGHQWLATHQMSHFPLISRTLMDDELKPMPMWARDNHMIGVARVELTVEEIIK